jgi:exonuclease III
MSSSLRIATWNIAGARKMRSLSEFDYEAEDIQYFADRLTEINPDIICLQESHTSEAGSIAGALASKLNMPYVHNDIVSPSHIDSAYRLGNAVIASVNLDHVKNIIYPYPEFGHTLANGKPSQHHDKILQIFHYGNITIANTQMLPLGIFGRSYNNDEGLMLANDIEAILLANLKTPLVLCGDINFDQPSRIYPKFFQELNLREVLPDTATRPAKEKIKKTPDHIIISPEITATHSEVVLVQADHYLCYADISI